MLKQLQTISATLNPYERSSGTRHTYSLHTATVLSVPQAAEEQQYGWVGATYASGMGADPLSLHSRLWFNIFNQRSKVGKTTKIHFGQKGI